VVTSGENYLVGCDNPDYWTYGNSIHPEKNDKGYFVIADTPRVKFYNNHTPLKVGAQADYVLSFEILEAGLNKGTVSIESKNTYKDAVLTGKQF
jgi:hypothetical protein